MARHLHFDCFSGISGDMTLGALVDVGLPFKDLVRGLTSLRIDGFRLARKRVERGAISATKVDVLIDQGFRTPLTLSQIAKILRKSGLPPVVKERSQAVFDVLADAEGKAHGVEPSHVHFHEVGVIDSFVDVVGGVLGLHLLDVQRVTASAVNVGSGMLQSAHGALPVPGPAVAALAVGVPIYAKGPERELTTPTGMALLRTLATDFECLPPMQVRRVGYGAGTADPAQWANVLRVFIGDAPASGVAVETIVELHTNLDDLNPQVYETVFERLFAAGAVDATLAPVTMKKGRPGTVLSVLAPREQVEAVLAVLFSDTTALGVRTQDVQRRVLPRRFASVQVQGGDVRIKVADHQPGRSKAAPEYDDCKRIAEQSGRPVKDILEEAMLAFRRTQAGTKRTTKRA
ncbi:MAG TPA: nickel pincer cofactor biosynthesis protein LarC [Nitrospira sp.]|nr:nickel pincer cofactor biosynthesis protein LarC [Nitrospira sp.]HUM38264.1 nickel pincer cofactor biosynthesis protein LarC [Nitrospira sp.]